MVAQKLRLQDQLIGLALEEARTTAGLRVDEVAVRGVCSRKTFVDAVRGRRRLSTGMIRSICEQISEVAEARGGVRVPREVVTQLSQMCLEADERGWWDLPEHVDVPPHLRTLGQLEHLALAVDHYEPAVVPGPLQTADYARHTALGYTTPPDPGLAGIPAARRHRAKELLARHLPVRAVVLEDAWTRPCAPADVLSAQHRHVRTLVETGQAEVRILPRARGTLRGATRGPFVVFELPLPRPGTGASRMTVAHVEAWDGARVVLGEPATTFRDVMRSLREASVPLTDWGT